MQTTITEALQKGAGLIEYFKRPPTVTLLVELLESDPDNQVRRGAAYALDGFADPLAEPALLKAAGGDDIPLALSAAHGLSPLNTPAGLQAALRLLKKASPDERETAIDAVTAFHRKGAVVALLDAFERPPADAEHAARIHDVVTWRLTSYAAITADVLGPPPDTAAQWRDWWAQVEPLLTDDLKWKPGQGPAPDPAVKYVEADYANAPQAIELRAATDAMIYRVGEPIRLNLEMQNHSNHPYSLLLPRLPSGWSPTMAYGLRLKRNSAVLLDLKPSGDYEGSYSPPDFETLSPAGLFRSSACLQHWLSLEVDLPLQEGNYELTVAFDSSKFPGVETKGMQLVHRWEAKPIRFTVKGSPLENAHEILRVIGVKSGLKWIEQDLSSPQTARRQLAWDAVFAFGDSRLASFLNAMKEQDPDAASGRLNSVNLAPFKSKAIK